MDKQPLLKNIPFAEPQELAEMVTYQPGQVVSRTLAQNPFLSLTVFAFDAGEGISAHTVTADALVQIIDGQAKIKVGEKQMTVKAGQVLAMPEGVPHGLHAQERFKMVLFVVKRPQGIGPVPGPVPGHS